MKKSDLSREEAFTKKRFEHDGFKVTKVDTQSIYKSPDFLLTKPHFDALVEVKIGFKKGKILETLSTGASRFDPYPAVEDYFRTSEEKLNEFLANNPNRKRLPYILVFNTPFFIDNELEWEVTHYQIHTGVSAVFIPRRTHPHYAEAEKMSIDELEAIIHSTKRSLLSQTTLNWDVILNSYATNPLKIGLFNSISKVKHI